MISKAGILFVVRLGLAAILVFASAGVPFCCWAQAPEVPATSEFGAGGISTMPTKWKYLAQGKSDTLGKIMTFSQDRVSTDTLQCPVSGFPPPNACVHSVTVSSWGEVLSQSIETTCAGTAPGCVCTVNVLEDNYPFPQKPPTDKQGLFRWCQGNKVR